MHKFIYKYCLILILSLLGQSLFAQKQDSLYDQLIQEYIRVGSENLSKLIAQNNANDQAGHPELNSYVFDFKENGAEIVLNPVYLKILPETVSPGRLGSDFFSKLEININAINADIPDGKPKIYIGVDQFLDYAYQQKITDKEGVEINGENIKSNYTYLKENVSTAFNEIYNSLTSVLPTPIPSGGIEVVALGFYDIVLLNKATIVSTNQNQEARAIEPNIYVQTAIEKGFRYIQSPGSPQEDIKLYFTNIEDNFSKNLNEIKANIDTANPNIYKIVDIDAVNYATQLANNLKQGILGQILREENSLFYNDCYKPNGVLLNRLASSVLEEQVIRIGKLVDEILNQQLYNQYLQPALVEKKALGDITKEDLDAMEKSLLAMKDATSIVFGNSTPTNTELFLNWLIQCDNANYSNCDIGRTFVPRCTWDRTGANVGNAMTSGFIDGAVDTIWSLFELVPVGFNALESLTCFIPSINFFSVECANTRADALKFVQVFADLPKFFSQARDISTNIFSQIGTDLTIWTEEATENTQCGHYRRGRLIFDAASAAIGLAELKAAAKGFSLVSFMENFAAKAKTTLSKITLNAAENTIPKRMTNLTKIIRNKSYTYALNLSMAFGGATFDAASFVNKTFLKTNIEFSIKSNLNKAVSESSSYIAKIDVDNIKIGQAEFDLLGQNAIKTEIGSAKALAIELTETNGKVAQILLDEATDDVKFSILKDAANLPKAIIAEVVKPNTARKLIAVATIIGTTINKFKRLDEPNPSNCDICSQRLVGNSSTEPSCLELNDLANKNPKVGLLAVNKICQFITTANFKPVVTKLNLLLPKQTELFLQDLVNNTQISNSLANNISSLNLNIINAWLKISKAIDNKGVFTEFTSDFALLQKVANLSIPANETIFNQGNYGINNLDTFLNKYSYADCNTCNVNNTTKGLPKYMPLMDEILTNSFYAQQTFFNFNDYQVFASREPFNQGNTYSHDGGQHMLKGMNSPAGIVVAGRPNVVITPTIIEKIDLAFGGPSPYASNKYDLLLKLGNTTGIRFVEFKSYQEETELAKGAINQFLGYLSDDRLTSLNQLLYVFNAKKTDVIAAKEIMRKVFKDNAEKIYKSRPAFFDNIPIENIRVIETFEDLQYFASQDSLKADFYSRILQFVTIN